MGKKKILIVDDETSLVDMLTLRLEANHYEVLTAHDGQEALEKARSTNPDLVVLDLMLPKMNGYEVCTMLKQDTRYQKIPIIILTARAQEEDEKLGYACGADGYIRKPFQAPELLDQIRRLLG